MRQVKEKDAGDGIKRPLDAPLHAESHRLDAWRFQSLHAGLNQRGRGTSMRSFMGFTLTELMITVAIAAIVLAIGIPSFRDTIRENRLTTYNNQFITALNLARSQAISRGSRVTLCPSTGADCEAIGYENGWIVFTDPNGNAKLDAGEVAIRIFEKMPDGMTLTGNSNNVATYISYDGSGFSRLKNSDAFQAGTLTLCKDGKARQIVIGSTGRLRADANPTSFTCP